MPDNVISLNGFAGLNLTSPPHMIKDKELQECTNFDIGLAGELTRRPGSVIRGNLPVSDTVGYILQFVGRAYLSAGGDGVILYDPGSHTVYSTGSGIPPFDGFNIVMEDFEGFIVWGAQYAGKYYLGCNAFADKIWEYDGTTSTVLTNSPPHTGAGIVFKDRLWAADGFDLAATDSKVYFSEPGDVTEWVDPISGSANSLDVQAGDGDKITKFAIINDVLYIFKRFSTWALYVQGDTPDDWVLRNISPALGCIGVHGAVEFEDIVYLITNQGFFKFNGVSFTCISDNLFNSHLHYFSLDEGVPTGLSNVVIKFNDRILFQCDFGTFIYYPKVNAWTKWEWRDFPYFLQDGIFIDDSFQSANDGLYFSVKPYDIYTEEELLTLGQPIILINDITMDVFQDGAIDYIAMFATKDFDFGKSDEFKRIMWASVDMQADGALDSNFVVDDTALAVDPLPGTITRSIRKITGPGAGRRFVFECAHAAASAAKIYSISFRLRAKSRVSSKVTL